MTRSSALALVPPSPWKDRPLRLLMSARDPGAAENIGAIAARALQRAEFHVKIVAMPPASEIMMARGLPVLRLPSTVIVTRRDPERAKLLSLARRVVAEFPPDAILVGGSNPNAGIDEALIAVGPEGRRYAFQSLKGEVNRTLGILPDCFFVCDREAAVDLAQRLKVQAVVAGGQPKHANYSDIDIPALRHKFRAALGIAEGVPLIGIFLQTLWDVPGYQHQWEGFAESLLRTMSKPIVLLRRHPKDGSPNAAGLAAKLRSKHLHIISADELPLEPTLVSCDLVTTAYSSSLEDYLALLANSTVPLGYPLYFMVPSVLVRFRRITGLSFPPPFHRGLAALCGDCGLSLDRTLRSAITKQYRKNAWSSARSARVDPFGASDRILDTILADSG